MTTFKAGDRVKLSGYGINAAGLAISVQGRKGAVVELFHDGTMSVRLDGAEWTLNVYRSQCRKLVKRKAREWWLNVYDDMVCAHATKESAVAERSYGGKTIHVREVLGAKKERRE